MTAQEAKRAFVTVLLALAAVYGLVLNITRDSADTELVTAFKRVARKAHPDKGGTVEDSARLHASRDAWKDALLGRRKPGRPSSDSTQGDNERGPRDENGVRQDGAMADPEEIFGKRRAEYRIRGQGVMLTYSGVVKRRTVHMRVPLIFNLSQGSLSQFRKFEFPKIYDLPKKAHAVLFLMVECKFPVDLRNRAQFLSR